MCEGCEKDVGRMREGVYDKDMLLNNIMSHEESTKYHPALFEYNRIFTTQHLKSKHNILQNTILNTLHHSPIKKINSRDSPTDILTPRAPTAFTKFSEARYPGNL